MDKLAAGKAERNDAMCECGHGVGAHGSKGFRPCDTPGCPCQWYLEDSDGSEAMAAAGQAGNPAQA